MEQATPGAFGGNAFDFGVKFSFKSCNIFFFFLNLCSVSLTLPISESLGLGCRTQFTQTPN